MSSLLQFEEILLQSQMLSRPAILSSTFTSTSMKHMAQIIINIHKQEMLTLTSTEQAHAFRMT